MMYRRTRTQWLRFEFANIKRGSKFRAWRVNKFLSLGGICPLCGRQMKLTEKGVTDNSPDTATADHILELTRGGVNSFMNYQLICYQCNQDKEYARKLKMGRLHKAVNKLNALNRLEWVEVVYRRRYLNFPYIRMVLAHRGGITA